MKKRIATKMLAVILTVVLLLGYAPLNSIVNGNLFGLYLSQFNVFNFKAEAASKYYESGIYKYIVENNEAYIADCDSEASGEIVIPSNAIVFSLSKFR